MCAVKGSVNHVVCVIVVRIEKNSVNAFAAYITFGIDALSQKN